MVFEVPIFCYSKYCRQCRDIIEVIDPNDFVFVCIDNVDVRKRILSDTHYGIRSVPCILVFQGSSEKFHKYEGDDVVRWLEMNDMIVQTENESAPEPEVEPVHVVDLPPLPPRRAVTQTPSSLIAENPIPPNNPSIDSRLPTIVESELENDVSAPLLTSTIMTEASMEGGDVSSSMMDPSGMSDGMSSATMTTASKKPNSIMNLAQQMQRERESEDRPTPSSS